MSNTSLPDLWHFVAFAADPGDPTSIPTWTSVGHMLTEIDQLGRGSQYELAQSRVWADRTAFFDPDEYLNPVNTASPYYPFCQPYRQSLHLAGWTRGQTGNLLNTAVVPGREPVDGSFESYAVGEVPAWITTNAIGGAVTTTNPQQGSQDFGGTTTATTNRQGISYSVPCVPGMQYTSSAYVRQTAANSWNLRCIDQTLTADPFNRTTASGWGTPPSPSSTATPAAGGTAWTLSGGANSDRSTTPATLYAPGYASVNMTSTATSRYQLQALSTTDVRQRVRFQAPVIATGDLYSCGVVARYADSSNHYYCELQFATDRTVTLRIVSRVAGADTTVATQALNGIAYSAGDEFFLDFYITGTSLQATAWRLGQFPPDVSAGLASSGWLISTTSTSITAAGSHGVRYRLNSGNTNTSPVMVCYNYSAVGSVESSTTTTTGAYVRLSVTWTATQPTHAMTLSTTATSAGLASTVNIDAVQHEQAASASAFTTAGSTLYPVARPYIERMPRTWDDQGFTGRAPTDGVDGLAALAAISLPSEYDYAVMKLSPDFYYPLSGGEDTTLYPEASGNGGPPLGLNISKYGVGTLPGGGGALGIPGGAGATGVQFYPPTPATGTALAATCLGTGPIADTPQYPLTVPAAITTVWRMTAACVVRVDDSGAAGQTAFACIKPITTSGTGWTPIQMNLIGSTVYTNYAGGTSYSLTSGSGLSGINVEDGLPHLLVGIVVQDTAGDTVVYRYVDDELDGIATATTASLGGTLAGQSDSLTVGALDDGYQFSAVANGVIGKLALWNRELSVSETAALKTAFDGHADETTGDRVNRHLTQGGYFGARRISNVLALPDPGAPITTMQAPSWTGAIDLLTDSQNTTVAEQGKFWPAPDGAIVMEGRNDRFQRLVPTWTFGEDVAGGEYPYEGSIAFDFDATFVFADVQVSRPGAGTATGGYAVDIARTRARYFPRSYGANMDVADDAQAQDAADWIFYSHRAPSPRVASILFHPAALATLWPMVLGVEIGQRVTVKRRPKAANAGAGITMSADYFVETVRHQGIRMETGEWWTELVLSPIGAAPGPTAQPWILEDATYGVLGSTTVLGF